MVTILILIDGFLQFEEEIGDAVFNTGHNPYFNRWFSAIKAPTELEYGVYEVTILILIDGFLQYIYTNQ